MRTKPNYEFTQDWVTRKTVHWQVALAHLKHQPVAGLEIGSYEGRSATWFLDNILTHSEAKLVCVDPHDTAVIQRRRPKFDNLEPMRLRFLRNTDQARREGRLEYRRMTSREYFEEHLRGSGLFSFIYVDGDHTEEAVAYDAMQAWSNLLPGGVIIFDDYEWKWAESRPKPAIDAFLDRHVGGYDLLHKDYQVIIRKHDS